MTRDIYIPEHFVRKRKDCVSERTPIWSLLPLIFLLSKKKLENQSTERTVVPRKQEMTGGTVRMKSQVKIISFIFWKKQESLAKRDLQRNFSKEFYITLQATKPKILLKGCPGTQSQWPTRSERELRRKKTKQQIKNSKINIRENLVRAHSKTSNQVVSNNK